MVRAFLLNLLLGSATAGAAGPVWQWTEAPRSYSLVGDVNVPGGLMLAAPGGATVLVHRYRIDAHTTCSVERPKADAWDVSCRLDDVAVQAWPMMDEAPNLQLALDGIDPVLTGATVQFQLSRTGRAHSVVLHDAPGHAFSSDEQRDTLRLMLERLFASFDLELPHKGEFPNKGWWKSKTNAAMAFPSAAGTEGHSITLQEPHGKIGDVVRLQTFANGVMGPAQLVLARADDTDFATQYKLQMTGEAKFDMQRGALIARHYLVRGRATGRAQIAKGYAGVPYVQAVRLALIEGTPTPLGPSVAHERSVRNVHQVHAALIEALREQARDNEWARAEPSYVELRDLPFPLLAEEQEIGALAALHRGDIYAARERFLDLIGRYPGLDYDRLLDIIERDFGRLTVLASARQALYLEPSTPSDDDGERRAIRYAAHELQTTGAFDGMVPVGSYRVGDQPVVVEAGKLARVEFAPAP